MGLYLFLTVVQGIIAAALVGVVLMQRSEGGGLGVGGGSPGGLMSARGAADFLTRTTKWLAVLFVTLSIVLAAMAVQVTTGTSIDDSLDRTITPRQQTDPLAPAVGGGAAPAVNPAAAPGAVPAPAAGAPAQPVDPLAGAAN